MKAIVSSGKIGASITAFDSVVPFDTSSTTTFRMCGMVGLNLTTTNSEITGISMGIYWAGGSIPFLTGVEEFSSVYFEVTISMDGSTLNCHGFYIPARNSELPSGGQSGMRRISESLVQSSLGEIPINFYARSSDGKQVMLYHAMQEIL